MIYHLPVNVFRPLFRNSHRCMRMTIAVMEGTRFACVGVQIYSLTDTVLVGVRASDRYSCGRVAAMVWVGCRQ